jgi:hypothetical protein
LVLCLCLSASYASLLTVLPLRLANGIKPRKTGPKSLDLALDDSFLSLEGTLPGAQTLVPDLALSQLLQPLLGLAILQQVRERLGKGIKVRDKFLARPPALQHLVVLVRRLLDAREQGGVLDGPLVLLRTREAVACINCIGTRGLPWCVRLGARFGSELCTKGTTFRGDDWCLRDMKSVKVFLQDEI